MIISAHELTKTLICAAERCEHDAEPNSTLCYRCQRLDTVKIHVTPQRLGDLLRCSACEEHKPDEAFSRSKQNTWRRHRHQECKDCSAKRRLVRAADPRVGPLKRVRTPEQKARKALTEKARRERMKAQLGWPPA